MSDTAREIAERLAHLFLAWADGQDECTGVPKHSPQCLHLIGIIEPLVAVQHKAGQEDMREQLENPDHDLRLAVARSIGETISVENHMERSRQALKAAAHAIAALPVEDKP